MRYAIISDIHANLPAWKSILADLELAGAETLVCLGDIVGYGPRPQAVLDGVRSLAAGTVLGNHDAAVCGRMSAAVFNDSARSVIDWTRSRIDRAGLKFLKGLPLAIEDEDILFVHAETIEPARFSYIREPTHAAQNLAACTHRIVFHGHTHHQSVFSEENGAVREQPAEDFFLADGSRYLVDVGSAGEPRDPCDLRGRYVLFDSAAGSVQFRAVEFDTDAYRADLRREGLKTKPFFIRVLDQRSREAAIRLSTAGELAMTRAAAPPAGSFARPERLVLSLASHATPRRSRAAILAWIAASLLVAALVPVGCLALREHSAKRPRSGREGDQGAGGRPLPQSSAFVPCSTPFARSTL